MQQNVWQLLKKKVSQIHSNNMEVSVTNWGNRICPSIDHYKKYKELDNLYSDGLLGLSSKQGFCLVFKL